MKKVYGIYEYRYANEEGEMIAVVSSKAKAVDYIKVCVGDTKEFSARRSDTPWYEAKWCYDKNFALTKKNILNYRYCTKGSYSYYVKEIDVI